MNKKRIVAMIGFVLVTILLGYAIYRVFFAPKTPESTVTQTGETISGQFPTAGEGQTDTTGSPGGGTSLPTSPEIPFSTYDDDMGPDDDLRPPLVNTVINQPVSNISADTKGNAKFYNQTDGKFYRVGKDGSVESLTDTTFYNVSNVNWSPTRDEAIIEYPDGANIYYNFDTKKQVTLPPHWETFSFDNSGNQITAKSMGFSEENRWLITADPEGNNTAPIEPLGQNASRVIVDWSPNGSVLALSRTGEPLSSDRQEVLLIGKYGENFKSIIVEGRDLRTAWSPDGNKLLHSVYSSRTNYVPELWIVDASGSDATGSGRKLLNVSTWADKCAFADERYVYCGVPITMEPGAGFVPALEDQTPDQIIRIDTRTGLKQPLDMDETHTVQDIFVSNDGQTLYFSDKNSAGLFEIALYSECANFIHTHSVAQ